MWEARSKPELEVFESGDIQLAKQLIKDGVLDLPALFQVVTGIRYGFEMTPQTMAYARSMLPSGAIWAGFGVGRMMSRCWRRRFCSAAKSASDGRIGS